MATNVYALLLFLPSMHAWLWLPQVRNRSAVARGLVFAAGLIGPALFLGLFAKRFGLGLDTPWYLAELTAIGYVPIVAVVLALAWAAAAAQLLVGAAGRYAPYPGAAEGAPPGVVRSGVRTVVLGVRGRRRRPTTRQGVRPDETGASGSRARCSSARASSASPGRCSSGNGRTR